jgi:hypothetical protein
MINIWSSFNAISITEPELFKNFSLDLGSYFQKSFENFFAFMYTLYSLFSKSKPNLEPETDDLDISTLLELINDESPIIFYVLVIEKLGDSQIGKLVWPYTDASYLFRLFNWLEQNKIDLKKCSGILIDPDPFVKDKNKTLTRNRIFENILKKQSILPLIEGYVFHITRGGKIYFFKSLLDLCINYEKILAEGEPMKQELIDIAVSLGESIGISLQMEGKKGKGDLFRLRKSRRPEDFLNEINRLQMRYNLLVPSDLYLKGEQFQSSFTEFKQFCMIAALNSYNGGSIAKQENSE